MELGIPKRDGISQNGDVTVSAPMGWLVVAERTLIGTENKACFSSSETEVPSINKCLLSTYYVPCPVLSARNRTVDKTDKFFAFEGLCRPGDQGGAARGDTHKPATDVTSTIGQMMVTAIEKRKAGTGR